MEVAELTANSSNFDKAEIFIYEKKPGQNN